MRQVYLSPHLDDAVLSCGGAIHRRAESGEPVWVLTLFAGEFACALGYYRTQLATLFGGTEAMPSRLWAFAASRSPQMPLAERLWWPPGA